MRIAIVGAGSLGSQIAGLLAMAQEQPPLNGEEPSGKAEIWLVGSASSEEHLKAIERDGLQFEPGPGLEAGLSPELAAKLHTPIKSLHLTTDPALAYPCDLAIVLVKSYRTAEAAGQVAALLGPEGLALSLQNGLGNREILAETLGAERVALGTTRIGANLLGPGRVFMAALSTTHLAAEIGMSPAHQSYLQQLKHYLERVGVPVVFSPDVQGTIWGKLILNCAINPIAALLDWPNGAVVENPATLELSRQVTAEVVAVAEANGIKLPFPAQDALAQVVQIATVNAANFCSMVQDLRRGRPTEIEALNGAVVRQAERLGLDVLVNRTLTSLIRARQISLPTRPA